MASLRWPRLPALLLFSSLATSTGAFAGVEPDSNCNRLLTVASGCLARVEYAEARKLYELAAKDEACKLGAKLGLAEVSNRTGRRREALREASEVLASTADPLLQAEAEFQIGNSAYRRGGSWNDDRRKAEAAFLRAIELSGGQHVGAMGQLKKLYAEVGEQKKLAELDQRFPSADASTQKKAWPDLSAPLPDGHQCRYAGADPSPEVIRLPERIYDPQPQYPEEVRKAGIEGTVTVVAVINERGLIDDVVVTDGLHPSLDKITTDTIRSWRFKPATTGEGKPVPCYYTLTTTFKIL